MTKTWFITGAGRGFGLEFATNALERGDRVAATARNTSALEPLLAAYGDALLLLQLDVTDRDGVFSAVQTAAAHFGQLDVIVNNAGYGLFGMIEEITPEQLREQMEVNLLGVLHVVQAALPILRAQGSGHIIQISTIGGVVAFPNLGGYHASKWALEGLTESLAQEVAGQGIKVTLIEPGGFTTDWAGSSAVRADAMPEYDAFRQASAEAAAAAPDSPMRKQGDPAAAGRAILKIVDAQDPPLRAFFGVAPTMVVPAMYAKRLATWEEWKPVALEANG